MKQMNVDNFRIHETEDEVAISYYYGQDENVAVPAEIHGKPVTCIKEYAFYDQRTPLQFGFGRKFCVPIKSVCLPNTLKRMEAAFRNCDLLEEITIPAGVEYIDPDCFQCCYNLKAIHVSSQNPFFSEKNGILYSKDGSILVRCPQSHGCVDSSVLDGVTEIADSAFNACVNLHSISIPNTVKVINSSAFSNCPNLTEVSLHPDVALEGAVHFSCCKALREIVFYNTKETLPRYCFYKCSTLKAITFPTPIKVIEVGAFDDCGVQRIRIPEKNQKFLSNLPSDLIEIEIPKTVGIAAIRNIISAAVHSNSMPQREHEIRILVESKSKAEKFCVENGYPCSYICDTKNPTS